MLRMPLRGGTGPRRRLADSLRLLCFLGLFLALPALTLAQRTVTGLVTDPDGEPLIGANVVVPGSTVGTVTDIDGAFELAVPDNTDSLIVTYTGYESTTIALDNRSYYTIELVSGEYLLDEVVVVGYGTVRKSDLTGSVGKVDVEESLKSPVARIDQAIQGRVSGVFVTSADGSPGANTTIRIRGGNSINAGNEPLYVIDGFVGGVDISSLNPNDIESIEILKDASAVSIYGARGSNGVVLITTKQGQQGRTQVSLNTWYGHQTLARKIDFMPTQEFMTWANEGEEFLGNPPAYTDEDRQRVGEGTDWQDELIRDAPMFNAQLSVQGGNERTQYYISGNYFDQEGILIGNAFNRAQLRLNINHQASDLFEIGANLNVAREKNIPQNFNINQVSSIRPTIPVYQEDGEYSRFTDINVLLFNNPVAADEFIDNQTVTNNIFANTYLQLNLLPNLFFKTTFGVTFRDLRRNQFTSSQLPIRLERGQPGSGSVFTSDRISVLTENTLNYNLEVNENHRLNFLAGFTYQRQQTENTNAIADQVLNDLLTYYGLGLASPENTRIQTDYDAWRISSLIGRVNYSLYDKYLITLTARQDGSSKFGSNNRYAFFPSVAVAWRLGEEPFIQNLGLFSNMKLRFSYGRSGNSNGIGSFTRFQTLSETFTSLGRGTRDVGIINQRLSNPDLRWETTDQFDLGFEFGFLDGRLAFELDLYYKKTEDLLFTREIPSQTGFSTRLENIGSLENRGAELTVNATIFNRPNFSWSANFNISTYQNEILDLGSENSIVTLTHGVNVSGPSGQLIVGEPLGIFTGFNVLGIYRDQAQIDADGLTNPYAPGEFRFEDVNGDGTIDFGDITIVGNSNPEFFGGLQNTFSFYNFDLSAFLQFVYGNDIFNERKLLITRSQERVPYADLVDHWTEDNRDTPNPRSQAQNAQASTSYAVEDGSFLRMKMVQLAYNFPVRKMNWPLSGLRLYVTAENLFQIVSDSYSNYDPEGNAFGTNDRLRGYDDINYPSARTFVFGIDARF